MTCKKIQYRHANSNAIFYLVKNDRLLAVGYIAGDLNTAVNWAGVHYGDLFIQESNICLFKPYSMVYSRREGKYLISWRSNCMRSILATSHQFKALIRLCSTFTPNEAIYFGIKRSWSANHYFCTNCLRQRIFESATRECRISPTITTFLPATSPIFRGWKKHPAKPG